jgi:hypothetical protein
LHCRQCAVRKKKIFLKMFLLPRATLLHCRECAVCTILLLFIMLLLYILDYQACTAVNALCDTVICVHPHTHTPTPTPTCMYVPYQWRRPSPAPLLSLSPLLSPCLKFKNAGEILLRHVAAHRRLF